MNDIEFLGLLVGGLAALLGLFSAFFKLIMKPLTEIAVQVKALVEDITQNRQEIKENAAKSRETHRRMWDEMDSHEDRLNDHERRIVVLEVRKHNERDEKD